MELIKTIEALSTCAVFSTTLNSFAGKATAKPVCWLTPTAAAETKKEAASNRKTDAKTDAKIFLLT